MAVANIHVRNADRGKSIGDYAPLISLVAVSALAGFAIAHGFAASRISACFDDVVFRPACAADFNLDGVPNSQDFFDFLAAFFALEVRADFNNDGVINSQDFFDFLAAFFAGC